MAIDPQDLSEPDRKVLAGEIKVQRYPAIKQAIADSAPAVQVKTTGAVRVLPRVKAGAAVIHLLNWGYDAGADGVRPLKNVALRLDLAALGVAKATEAVLFSPAAQPVKLPVVDGSVTVPELGLWNIVEIRKTR